MLSESRYRQVLSFEKGKESNYQHTVSDMLLAGWSATVVDLGGGVRRGYVVFEDKRPFYKRVWRRLPTRGEARPKAQVFTRQL